MDQTALSGAYSVEVTSVSAATATSLEADWCALQTHAKPSIFLDWLWVSTWLSCCQPKALLVRVLHAGELVALGIFAQHTERRHKALKSRVCLLHQTGLRHDDQVWVEYNGLLSLPGHETAALAMAIKTLQSQNLCDEVHLSMLPEALALGLGATFDGVQTAYAVNGFQFDLETARRSDQTIVDALSSNTRYQVRRSLRRYEKAHGAARVLGAQTLEQALRLFHEAGDLHRARWSDSGYRNPVFVKFHETLIKRGFDHGSAQLFSVAFGDYVIGVFYFLVCRGQAYFYLQGVQTETDGKLKPGLCGHALLMQYFLEQELDVYDFMGGESQYKRQLANAENRFVTLRIHNGRWRFLLEEKAREIKNKLQGP